MITVLTPSDIQKIVAQVGLREFYVNLIAVLENEFAHWETFQKSPRHATHVDHGVIELMPICDQTFYAFKYVNGHPRNAEHNKLTVVALGVLADVETGYPLLLSEMTLLTAFRTAATSALASHYLANKTAKIAGIIGTGAQSEFQIMAHAALFDIKTVRYFDIDKHAMQKFQHNLKTQSIELIACHDAKSVATQCDILTTSTASKTKARIIQNDWIAAGTHINGIGGDCPGKTELDPAILKRAKIVVEYFPQSTSEGEVQQLSKNDFTVLELWELVTKKKKGRTAPDDITLFDSVGFAIEDFAILKYMYTLAKKYHIGSNMDFIPDLKDPKNLFGMLNLNS